jgi:hypothetical protein
MPVSTTLDLGVCARLSLHYKNINIIKKLFSINKPIFIHGIKHIPIDYNENCNCFDLGILDILSDLNNEEEFKIKSLKIAEIRNDSYITCLRRKIQYCNQDPHKNVTQDDDQSWYEDFDLNKLIFDIFYKFSNVCADFDNDDTSYKTSYDTVSTSTKRYIDNLYDAIHFFKELGIDETDLVISNYNTCELY